MRFGSAAIIFMISYTLHRKFTFVDIKEVGVAIYLKKSENIPEIKSKIQFYPDFIHLDLVDKTYDPNVEDVDISILNQIKKEWPLTEKMIHIMSKYPRKWIEKTYNYVDYIIFHFEIYENISELIGLCRKYHRKVGISILHNTSIDSIIKYLDQIDIVQVLGVTWPGYSNQHLNVCALEKLSILNNLKRKYHFEICFDGGVKLSNIQKINAKYIVSGSTVLKSADSVKAIYDLKTSSRYYLETDIDLKDYLKEKIKGILESIDFVISGTIVGSFINYKGLIGIGDIDIVIIINRLTKYKFEKIINEFKKLGPIIKIDYDYEVIINTTFGPIKFNKEKTVVFHLMVYDIPRHINHCEESPFICLDWQISKFFVKSPISNIYRITTLQPNYFFNVRRSVKDYIKDLSLDSISYREYQFKGDKVIEEKKFKRMDMQDKFEFSYHIMKFCMINLLKLYYKENRSYPIKELTDKYFSLFPEHKLRYKKYFFKIRDMKESNNLIKWKKKNSTLISSFIADFYYQFNKVFNIEATHLFFIRHAKTFMNQAGIFVGRRSNPDIIKVDKNKIKELINFLKKKNIKKIYSSPLKRCIQTINIIKKEVGIDKIYINENLCEIDYGKVDGKSYFEVKASYPSIIKKWEDRKDPKFPEGENTNDVLIRVNGFLSSFRKERKTTNERGDYLICTHNVFLRCLIGQHFNIPKHKWHIIEIPYIEAIEFILTKEGRYYINLTPKQRKTMFRKISFSED